MDPWLGVRVLVLCLRTDTAKRRGEKVDNPVAQANDETKDNVDPEFFLPPWISFDDLHSRDLTSSSNFVISLSFSNLEVLSRIYQPALSTKLQSTEASSRQQRRPDALATSPRNSRCGNQEVRTQQERRFLTEAILGLRRKR